ncbi:ATP-binding protein [Marinivivus vitaminiproducens]|uniref:ATP-binding protein n=1 Tax=Marinivivus vitaminiproducens TaxID=3035935 RepID=UPI0027A25837|nr:histidine kinase [Geminicoccaceae bacterium SCSIO 64248]
MVTAEPARRVLPENTSASAQPPGGSGLEAGRIGQWWFRRSVRSQILLTFVAISLLAEVLAATVVIGNARLATGVEIDAALTIAERFVEETVDEAVGASEDGQPLSLAEMPLHLAGLRHVRIVVEDAQGRPVVAVDAEDDDDGDARDAAPAWFAAMVGAFDEARHVPVVVDGQRLGTVTILGEPADEIAEVWDDASALALITLLTTLAVLAALFFALNRILDPLPRLARGMHDLEHRNYAVHLAEPKARELAAITTRFNALAAALARALNENAALNRRLLTVQDEERHKTALELHDEVGPCLFGLGVAARSVKAAAARLPEPAGSSLGERATEIQAIVERLRVVNRTIQQRLRPMALGHVALADMIRQVVDGFERQQPTIRFDLALGPLAATYGDSVDLTVYRCLQESLLNAVRHAEARHIDIRIGEGAEAGGRPEVRILVDDDGSGFDLELVKGFGLSGIEERVRMLGGRCAFEGNASGGSRVRVQVPLTAAAGPETLR